MRLSPSAAASRFRSESAGEKLKVAEGAALKGAASKGVEASLLRVDAEAAVLLLPRASSSARSARLGSSAVSSPFGNGEQGGCCCCCCCCCWGSSLKLRVCSAISARDGRASVLRTSKPWSCMATTRLVHSVRSMVEPPPGVDPTLIESLPALEGAGENVGRAPLAVQRNPGLCRGGVLAGDLCTGGVRGGACISESSKAGESSSVCEAARHVEVRRQGKAGQVGSGPQARHVV